MTHKHNGGPAFPDPGRAQSVKQRELLGNPGMSLRDWFAGLTMQGECAASTNNRADPRDVAEFAYRVADAMLAEREK